MNNISLSICIIVKDDSEYLPYAIESVKDIASEIIIINACSNDNCKGVLHTPLMQFLPEIKIFDFVWNNDFSETRNEALKHATQEWILFLNADSVISAKSCNLINTYLNKKDKSIFYLKFIENDLNLEEISNSFNSEIIKEKPSVFISSLIMDFDIYLDNQNLRDTTFQYLKPVLFKNGIGIKYTGKINEKIQIPESIKPEVAEIYIHCYSYDKKHLLTKSERINQIIDSIYDEESFINEKIKLKSIKIINKVSTDEENRENLVKDIFDLHNDIETNISSIKTNPIIENFYYKSVSFLYKDSENSKASFKLLLFALNIFPDSKSLLYIFAEILLKLNKFYEAVNVLNYINFLITNRSTLDEYMIPQKLTDTDEINFVKANIYFRLFDYQAFEYYFSEIKNTSLYISEYYALKESPSYMQCINNYTFTKKLTFDLNTDSSYYLLSAEKNILELHYSNAFDSLLNALKMAFTEEDTISQMYIFSYLLIYAKAMIIDKETFSEILNEGMNISNNFSFFWYSLGRYYLSVGKAKEAVNNLEKALEIEIKLQKELPILKNEIIENNSDWIDIISQVIYNPYNHKLIEDSLKIAITASQSGFGKQYEEIEDSYLNKDFDKALDILNGFDYKIMNSYERYVLYDYLSLIYEWKEDYKKSNAFLNEAIKSIQDNGFKIREQISYEKIYYKKDSALIENDKLRTTLEVIFKNEFETSPSKELRSIKKKFVNRNFDLLNIVSLPPPENKSPKGAPVSINSGVNPGPKEFGGNLGLNVRGILNTNKNERTTYHENTELLKYCFEDLGIKSTHTFNSLSTGSINILFPYYCNSEFSNYAKKFNYIIFQLEQLAYIQNNDLKNNYLDLLKNALCIWDYSETNIRYLNGIGINNTELLLPAYHKKMEVIDFNNDKTIDILFYGELNPRRTKILNKLISKGYKVIALNQISPKERNELISKAKIILHIRKNEISLLESNHLSFLINNRCFVISESHNYLETNHFTKGIVFSNYENIVEVCEYYMKPENDILRKEIAENGYKSFSKYKMMDNIQKVLEHL